MAVRKGGRPGVREALIRSEREWNDQVERWGFTAPSRSRLDALTAGEPVVVAAWEVAEFLPVLLWRWQQRWGCDVRVEPDGSIVPCGPTGSRAGPCTWWAGTGPAPGEYGDISLTSGRGHDRVGPAGCVERVW